MNARPWLLLAPILLSACASSSPPPSTPAQPAPSAAPAMPSSQPVPAPAPQQAPSAEVTAVSASEDGESKARAKVLFSNPTKCACRVLAYTLVWAGSKKTITLRDLTIPPGETRERWIKVAPDDGDLAALTPEAAKVELRSDCGG